MAAISSAADEERPEPTGTSLVNTLFVLDEPTVGLHPTDIAPLNGIMRELASRGNTVLVVEHDPEIIRSADHLLDLGPGPGKDGGRVLFNAPLSEAEKAPAETPEGESATLKWVFGGSGRVTLYAAISAGIAAPLAAADGVARISKP